MIHPNSLSAYAQKILPSLTNAQRDVLTKLDEMMVASNEEVALARGKYPNQTSGRFTELKEAGHIRRAYTIGGVDYFRVHEEPTHQDWEIMMERGRQRWLERTGQTSSSTNVQSGLFALILAGVLLLTAPARVEAKSFTIRYIIRLERQATKSAKIAQPTPTPSPKNNTKQSENKSAPSALTYPSHSHKTSYAQIQAAVQSVSNESDAFMEIIAKESGFNPHAINSSSGACGLGQALPCAKMPCSLDDVRCQVNWMNRYITARYGTPTAALTFHRSHGWY